MRVTFYLCVALFALLGNAQVFNTQRRVYDNSVAGVPIVAVAAVGGPSACTTAFISLRNDNSRCAAILSNDTYVPTLASCPPALVGATALSCVTSACYALNPAQKLIAVLNNYITLATFTVTTTIDISALVTPKVFSAYQRDANTVELLVVDSSNNAVRQYTISTISPITSANVAVSFTGTPIGIFMDTPSTFIVGIAGATQLVSFPIAGGPATQLTTSFGNIQSISLDGFGNVHVYDAACACIQVVSSAGTVLTTVATNTTITFMSNSRRRIFAVDALGLMKFEDAPRVTVTTTPVVCASRNGSITVQVSGGDYPYNIMQFPDFFSRPLTVSGGSVTFLTIAPTLPGYPVTLLDDFQPRFLQITAPTIPLDLARRGFTNVTANTGNSSYYWNFQNNMYEYMNFNVYLNPVASINSDKYEWLQFAVNIGDGGQMFDIQVGWHTITIIPGVLPLNTWVTYKLHLPRLLLYSAWATPQAYFFRVYFMNFKTSPAGGPQNNIYFDSFTATPYATPPPNRMVYVFDKCFEVTSTVVPFIYQPFQVNVTSKEVSCNVATTTSSMLAKDGSMTATLMNGVGPFSYNWSYPTNVSYSNSSSIISSPDRNSTIYGFPSQTSFISIYENSLNSTWKDASTAVVYNLTDTTYFRSPPNSIAFSPLDDGQAIIFTIQVPVSPADFPTVEFWVNGGPTGGQTLVAWVYRSASSTNSIIPVGGQVSNYFLSGYIEIPKNNWIKATINLPPGGDKYNVITIVNVIPTSAGNNPPPSARQNTVWIDDLVLIGKNVISVTDSTGCVAVTARARIPSPLPLVQTVTVNNVKCYGAADGSVAVQMSGGVPQYTYTWSNSDETGSSRSGLSEGNITVGVRDSRECEFKEYVATILQPPALQLFTNTIRPKCYNGRGRATAIITGGSGSYTFSWSSPSGYPQVVLKPSPEPIFIDGPYAPFILFNAQTVCGGTGFNLTRYSPSHSGYCSMYLNFVGNSKSGIVGCGNCLTPDKHVGITFFIYADSQDSIDNLAVGFVRGAFFNSSLVNMSTLGVVPNTWCQVTVNLSIAVPDSHPDGVMFFSYAPEKMGVVIVDDLVSIPNVSNGGGYTTFAGYESEVDVVASQYFLTIVDSNGCSLIKTINITQPEEIKVNYNSTAPTSPAGSDGSITAVVTGGTPPYSYYWYATQETTQSVGGLSTGRYEVLVYDANGCAATATLLVDPYVEGITIRAYNSGMAGGLGAIASFGMLIALFSCLMLVRYWASFSKLGSFLSFMILLGCCLAFASALVLLPRPTDTLCIAFPWLLGIGFILVYGCLFIKTWALYQVWRKAIHYHKASLTPGYIMRALGVAVLVEAIFLSVWTAVDPPKAYLVNVINNSQEWQCDVERPTFWIIFLVVKGVWMVFGVALSILTRNIVKEYNESSSIAYAIYNNVLLGTIAIPLVILIKETPGGRVVVEVVVITLAFSFTLVVMFFKIWHNIMLPEKIVTSKIEAATKRTTASSSGGSVRSTHSSDGKSTNSAPESP